MVDRLWARESLQTDSEEPSDVQAYDKSLRKWVRITAKMPNAIEPYR